MPYYKRITHDSEDAATFRVSTTKEGGFLALDELPLEERRAVEEANQEAEKHVVASVRLSLRFDITGMNIMEGSDVTIHPVENPNIEYNLEGLPFAVTDQAKDHISDRCDYIQHYLDVSLEHFIRCFAIESYYATGPYASYEDYQRIRGKAVKQLSEMLGHGMRLRMPVPVGRIQDKSKDEAKLKIRFEDDRKAFIENLKMAISTFNKTCSYALRDRWTDERMAELLGIDRSTFIRNKNRFGIEVTKGLDGKKKISVANKSGMN